MAEKTTIYVIRDAEGKVVATGPGIRIGGHGAVAFLRPGNGQTLHVAELSRKLVSASAKELHSALVNEKMRHIKKVDEHFSEIVRKSFRLLRAN
jgi:hypothetical protein